MTVTVCKYRSDNDQEGIFKYVISGNLNERRRKETREGEN